MIHPFQTIIDPLAYWARTAPARECIIIDRHRLTYSDVYRGARSLAAAFLRMGLKRGDRIALWLPNGVEWVFAYFGAAALGITVVPINTRYRLSEAAYILEQSEAACLIYIDQFLNVDYAGMVEELVRGSQLKNVICVNTRRLPLKGIVSFADLMEAAPVDESDLAGLRPAAGEPAIIQYTSGTTAAPKGAVLAGGAYLRTAMAVAACQEISPGERFFSGAPFFHCSGSMHAVTTVFAAGGTLVTMPRWDAEEGMRLIIAEGCTVAHARLPHHDLASEDFGKFTPRLNRAVTTGPPEFLLRLHEEAGITGISNVYGMTETCGNISLFYAGDPLEHRVRSNGRPHPGLEVKVRDFETGQELSPGAKGELWVRGWNLMLGYYKKPEATSKVMDADGWFRTGDLCQVTEDGRIVLMGRLKDLIRVGGENLAPAEVEAVLERHPAILQAAVVAMPDQRLNEVPCAFVKLRPAAAAGEPELIQFCKERLANFKVPRRVVFVDQFPETATRKIEKYKLAEQAKQLVHKV